MEIVIREFQPGEERQIQKIGMSAFKSMEGLFISKPKHAKVAVVDGELAGSMYYQMVPCKKKSVCYITYAFVDPKFQGKGIGARLYRETIDYIRSLGCEVITALVKGDNVGSFGLIEHCGLRKCSMFEFAKLVGVKGILSVFWGTEHNIACGMDFYSTDVKEKKGSRKELASYMILNTFILLLSFWSHKAEFLPYIGGAVTVLAFVALLGSMIRLISKQRWQFRMNNCGLLVTMIITAIGGVFPMIGRWYPEKYSLEKSARRELCISALLEWDGLILAGVLLGRLAPVQAYWKAVAMVVDMMLIYRMIPTYPYSEFGGNRVWKYNKILYGIHVLMTGVLLYYIG